jgi:hypothetical protein
MSDLPTDGAGTPPDLKQKLDKALTSEPGLLRAVVKETLQRAEKEEGAQPPQAGTPDTPVPAAPPRRNFRPRLIGHRIVMDNPAQAEEIRAGLAQSEVDTIVFAEGKWIYLRQRAIAEETPDAVVQGKEGAGTDGKEPGGTPGLIDPNGESGTQPADGDNGDAPNGAE